MKTTITPETLALLSDSGLDLTLESRQISVQITQGTDLKLFAHVCECTVADILDEAQGHCSPEEWDANTWHLSLLQRIDYANELLNADSFETVQQAKDYLINKAPKGWALAYEKLGRL